MKYMTKIALDTRLSYLKPLLKYMKNKGMRLVRKPPKGQKIFFPVINRAAAGWDTHTNVMLPTLFSKYEITNIGNPKVFIPKIKNKHIRKLFRAKKPNVQMTVAHEVGHIDDARSLIGKSVPNFNTILNFVGPAGYNSKPAYTVVRETAASTRGAHLLKSLKIPHNEAAVNRIGNKALTTYLQAAFVSRSEASLKNRVKLLKIKSTKDFFK